MNYTIESGVPIPPTRSGPTSKYPFSEMKIGDSFFIPSDADSAKNVGSAAFCWARDRAKEGKESMKFSVRTLKDKTGSRCWRIT